MAIQAQFSSRGAVDWVDMGCGGGGGGGYYNHCFTLQQQKEYLLLLQQQQQQQLSNMQQQQQQQQQQMLQIPHRVCSSSASYAGKCNHTNVGNPSPQSMLAAYEEKQRREIDHYLKTQNERLRVLLHEQWKQQLSMVCKIVDAKALPVMRQRDEDIAQAREKTRELEEFLNKLEAENREWQRLAQEKEAMMISLSNTIERLKERNGAGCSSGDDAESCCDNREKEVGEEEDNMGALMEGRASFSQGGHEAALCRVCKGREACVLFLPCRHLSSCEACEGMLGACPVCLTPKKATIKALMG